MAYRLAECGALRIRVIQKPSQECVDGFWLYGFRVGEMYELDSAIATLFVVEGWGEPVINREGTRAKPPSPRPWTSPRVSSDNRRTPSAITNKRVVTGARHSRERGVK